MSFSAIGHVSKADEHVSGDEISLAGDLKSRMRFSL